MLCSLPGESDGASSTTSPRSRCAIHTWTKFNVASDVFQIKGDNNLFVTDYPSTFYLVEKMQSTTYSSIANTSAHWFSMFGPPLEIVTGNGPQYGGQPYEERFSKWNIKYTATSPRYPQVRTVKWIIHKCVDTGNDTLIALQQHRCTVHHWTATCVVQAKSSSTGLFALH